MKYTTAKFPERCYIQHQISEVTAKTQITRNLGQSPWGHLAS